MEQQDKMKLGIGTKELETLKPAKVKISGVLIREVKKDNKIIGDKVVCLCKHPGRVDDIEISKVVFLKNKKIKQSGLWFALDEDGLIGKSSALGVFLKKSDVESIEELKDKEIDTELDDVGFLSFKAY